MFSTQKKRWTRWSLWPRVGDGPDGASAPVNAKNAGAASLAKEKGKSLVAEVIPSPRAFLGENGNDVAGVAGDVDAWRRFKEVGLLDESVLQRKEKDALVQRILELEKKLHEYQYNMRLLLIEKKERTSKYEEIRQGFAEAEEYLKREQAAHMIAISEYEKQKENLQKALGVKKQCVADLEKALREMRGEIAEVKYTSDKKLAEAHALEASLEEKYFEIEGKLHSANAKLAEASRKSSEIDRKLVDVEAREHKLHKDYLSLNAEQKTYKKDLDEQREYLKEWEKNLQESQKRLLKGQHSINDREERANETDRVLKKKEEELEEARKMIEVARDSIKEKEDDISNRQKALASKEKEATIKIENLEKKEKELLAIEEKLNANGRVEMQKLLDDHNEALNSKKQEFELELEQRRKCFDDEMKGKLDAVDKKKIEIDWKEEQILERDQDVVGVANDSLNIQEESQGDYVHANVVATSSRRKRRLIFTSDTSTGELDAEDSISLGGRRKRHQISAPGTQTPGEKSIVEEIMEVCEMSQKLIQFETKETYANVDSDGDIMVELSGLSGEDEVIVDYDEDAEKHNASIGKKLWTFFTT